MKRARAVSTLAAAHIVLIRWEAPNLPAVLLPLNGICRLCVPHAAHYPFHRQDSVPRTAFQPFPVPSEARAFCLCRLPSWVDMPPVWLKVFLQPIAALFLLFPFCFPSFLSAPDFFFARFSFLFRLFQRLSHICTRGWMDGCVCAPVF